MPQYIDKSALVADIDKRLSYYKDLKDRGILSKAGEAAYRAIRILKSDINFLKVKDVDLEKEINKYISDNFFGSETMGFFAVGTNEEPNDQDIALCAQHFFELGLKVKQESNDDIKIGEAQIYLEDDGGESPYNGKQWLDLSCTEYEIPKTLFKDGDNVEILIRKTQKGE